LPTIIDPFAAGPALDALRAKFGDSEFGYRVQALFAYVIARLGAVIEEVNAQGHPDIRASWQGKTGLIQVKSLLHRLPDHRYTLTKEDLRGITPHASDQIGYLALLDCGSPAEWIVVEEARLRFHLGNPIHLVTLRADCDKALSCLCTEEFNQVIASFEGRLQDMTFALLSKRALAQYSL
jgi:hypothetical protein